jgi:hypothetical protein
VSTVTKRRGSWLTFVLMFLVVLAVIFVAFGGWKGLVIAPGLIFLAVVVALRIWDVGAMVTEGERDFDRMRREEVARRRARTGGQR